MNPEQSFSDESDLDQPVPDRPKYQFQVETSQFAKDYHDFDPFRTICEQKGLDYQETIGPLIRLEYFYTPERMAKLTDLSKKVFDDFKKYSPEKKASEDDEPAEEEPFIAEPFDPNLVVITAVYQAGMQSDPYGMVNTAEKDVHMEIWADAIANRQDEWSEAEAPIDEDKLAQIFIHESAHLYGARVRRIEKDGQEEIRRSGLGIAKDGLPLWKWLNEAVVSEMADSEYKKYFNGEILDTYKSNKAQFKNMCEALSQKLAGPSADDIKEFFRSACFGHGDLLPLRHLINPPYNSLKDFILATDAPFAFSTGSDMMTKTFDRLWSDLAQNKKTGFEENLIKDNGDRSEMTGRLNKLSLRLFGAMIDLDGFNEIVSQMEDLLDHSQTLSILVPQAREKLEKMKSLGFVDLYLKKELNRLIQQLSGECALAVMGDNHTELIPAIKNTLTIVPDQQTQEFDYQPFEALGQQYLEAIGHSGS